jgi:hypothetical protein
VRLYEGRTFLSGVNGSSVESDGAEFDSRLGRSTTTKPDTSDRIGENSAVE